MKVESVKFAHIMQNVAEKINVYEVLFDDGKELYFPATDELDAWRQGERFAKKLTKDEEK